MKIYVTADTHFGHKYVAEKRGYQNIDEMDETIIEMWNRTVDKKDLVYHLGDVSFRNSKSTQCILSKLNGTIRLIRGNHDKRVKGETAERFEWTKDLYTIKEDGIRFVCCHYPLMTWDSAHYGVYHLHGHSHGSLRTPPTTRLDVGWDVWGQPVALTRAADVLGRRQYLIVDHHIQRGETPG